MKITGPARYSLTFDAARYAVLCAKGTNKFSGIASSPLPKLYIASIADRPFYIGMTKQRMSRRLYGGWKADGKHGYYGYSWRHQLTEATIDVWCHEDPSAKNTCRDIETIEAEVVYLIRQAGQWPEYQTEIHFHPSSPEHREHAAAIAARYRLGSDNGVQGPSGGGRICR